MKKSAKEQVFDFIDRKLQKEYEKFKDGNRSDYYDWEDMKTELDELEMRCSEYQKEVVLYENYLKAKQLSREFRTWRDMQ